MSSEENNLSQEKPKHRILDPYENQANDLAILLDEGWTYIGRTIDGSILLSMDVKS